MTECFLMTPPAESTLPAPVLVVEDEPLIRERLQQVLAHLGYAADALLFAASLAEARACLAATPVALALVDLGLPDGSGIDLIAELRAADPALGILVISAWSTEDGILAALRAGATGYVLKERDDLEVTLSIRSVLRGGAPIDPFIARRLLAELQPPSPADAPAAPAQRETSCPAHPLPRDAQLPATAAAAQEQAASMASTRAIDSSSSVYRHPERARQLIEQFKETTAPPRRWR